MSKLIVIYLVLTAVLCSYALDANERKQRPSFFKRDPPMPIFDCEPLPVPPPATNVNKLHPGVSRSSILNDRKGRSKRST